MGRVVGIDLGTTNSAVAYVGDDGLPTLIHNREGDYITPSVVLFEGEEATVGKQAKNSEQLYPLDVVSFVKRQMGNPDFIFIPESGDTQYPAEAVSSYILRYLADCASDYFGDRVQDVVVTVPAYFGEAERTATKQAGEIAGLNVVRLINEPTAAAVSHSFKKGYRGNIVVYDLGGGTFDVTAMRVEDNDFKVLSTGGDKQLGGFDFDNALEKIIAERFVAAGGTIDQYDDAFSAELRGRVEETKIKLSLAEKARVHVSHGGVNERITILRQEFNDAVRDLVTRTRYMLDDVLDQAGLSYADIDKLLLVGGSTKMPIIRDSVRQWTGITPDMSVNPDEAVALGAAVLAATVGQTVGAPSGNSSHPAVDIVIQDVISVGLGVAVVNPSGEGLVNNVVVQPGTEIPCNVRASSFQTVGATDSLKFQVTEGDEDGVDLKYVTVKVESEVRLPQRVPAGHPLEVAVVATVDGQIEAELYDGETGDLLCQVPIEDQRNLKAGDVDRLRRVTKEIAIL